MNFNPNEYNGRLRKRQHFIQGVFSGQAYLPGNRDHRLHRRQRFFDIIQCYFFHVGAEKRG